MAGGISTVFQFDDIAVLDIGVGSLERWALASAAFSNVRDRAAASAMNEIEESIVSLTKEGEFESVG